MSDSLFNWVVLPILIFFARMCDVSLGTLRNVFIGKGLKRVVPIVAFFEVLIWLVSVGQIMKNLHNPICYIAFAGGYATGTYVGMYIERRLALGLLVLRIITAQDSRQLILALTEANVGITVVDGHGAKGPVKIIFTIIKRIDLIKIRDLIKKHNPNAFYTIEDIRHANLGVFPDLTAGPGSMDYIRRIFPVRVGK
jgi:uncharacterized protein YebE (UPF0316 family)